ncbi:hypothetical protein Tco_0695928 [Tanacetum coccineum]
MRDEIVENILVLKIVLSTDKEKVSTDKDKVSIDRPIVSTDGSKVSTNKQRKGTKDHTEDVLSTDKEKVSTDKEKVSTDRPIVSTDGSKVSTNKQRKGIEDHTGEESATQATQTPTSTIFGDDETIAKVLLNMSQPKQFLEKKGKGVELRIVKNTDNLDLPLQITSDFKAYCLFVPSVLSDIASLYL